jgi:hypothetical protein
MIKNIKLFEKFNYDYWRKRKYSLEEKFAIYNSMYLEARELGIFPLKNPLEDIEHCLRIAKVLNSAKSIRK